MTQFKKYLLHGIIIIIPIFLFLFKYKNNYSNDTIFIHDTLIADRYHNELKRDTIVRWYEKPFYKILKPDTVRYQIVDTVFVEKIKNSDVMIKVDKLKDKLIIKAVSINGKTLKEYIYRDAGRDFTISSVGSNLVFKTKNFYWTGINAIADYRFKISDSLKYINLKNAIPEFGIETGISYLDKYELNAGILYAPGAKQFFLKAGMKIKIF